MIRSFAILLVLLFLLNGCRPVGTEPETKPNVTVPTATQEPTVQETPAAPQTPSESDMHVLQQYVDIIRFLYGREGPSHDSVYIDMQSYHDQGALNAGRNWLLEHPEVDQWEDFIKGYWGTDCDWNRNTALDLFTCLEDVAIREDGTKYDASEIPGAQFKSRQNFTSYNNLVIPMEQYSTDVEYTTLVKTIIDKYF